MTTKERIIEQLERMEEAELALVEKAVLGIEQQTLIERRIALLDRITGIVSDPEDVRILEEQTRRRPLYGDRPLDL